MNGKILEFSVQDNSGIISGADGTRYTFNGSEWKVDNAPIRGMSVDFDVDEDGINAVAVYKALDGGSATPGSKNKTTAGLLAIFLGGVGVHKFYLGYTGSALVYCLINTVGWLVTWILLGLPNVALYVMALIEGIIYLTKSDEEFEQIYVVGKRSWF